MTITVKQILDSKNSSQVFTVAPDDTVQSAVEIMAAEHISSLPVLDGGNMVGIISERDYIRKAAPKRRLPWEILIRELMTTEVIHVTPDEKVDHCMKIMISEKIRHLPVMLHNELVGMVSITDVIRIRRSNGGSG